VADGDDMPFEPYHFILKRLNDHGYSAYFVGGCVRDFFMSKPLSDVDIATSAPQRRVEQLFKELDIDSSAAYFGVITLKKPVKCQIATYRSESNYHNHRYPRNITFVEDVTLDARRRDFTVNSLYLDKDMHLYDPYSGLDDLKKKVLRCIGDPADRLNEDALRILRAIRFSITLEFSMESELLKSCIELSPTLIYLKEDTIELERSKLLGKKLNKNQQATLEYYRKIIPLLSNYF
jgi:tRNA nucleotidyltransferase (CCA-adding enzyme)